MRARRAEHGSRAAAELREAARALGLGRGSPDRLVLALEAMPHPALLVTASGRVAFANAEARRQLAGEPPWLATALARPDGLARVAPLRVGRVALRLVVPTPRFPASIDVASLGLPPRLAQVAGELLLGRADKEIAEALGMPLATVRTYVARIYARLGVQSRVGLFWLARERGAFT